MRKNTAQTPLLALLRSLNDAQRNQLATTAGTTVSYLYALATCQRGACRSDLAMQIEKASRQMSDETAGVSPVVTMQELATMCVVGEPDGA